MLLRQFGLLKRAAYSASSQEPRPYCELDGASRPCSAPGPHRCPCYPEEVGDTCLSTPFSSRNKSTANGDCRKDLRERSRSPIERAVAPAVSLHGGHLYTSLPSLSMEQPLALTKSSVDTGRSAGLSPTLTPVERQQVRRVQDTRGWFQWDGGRRMQGLGGEGEHPQLQLSQALQGRQETMQRLWEPLPTEGAGDLRLFSYGNCCGCGTAWAVGCPPATSPLLPREPSAELLSAPGDVG